MPGQTGPKRLDWPQMRREFTEGYERPDGEGTAWPTLDEIATKFGCAANKLRERAAREEWTTLKEIFIAKRDAARQEKRIQVLAGRGAQFDNRMLTMAEAQAGMIAMRMNELSQVGHDGQRRAAPSGEIQRLALALRTVQVVGRIALGEPTGESMPGSTTVRIIRESPAPEYDD